MGNGVYNRVVRQMGWRTGVREVNVCNAVRRAMIANIQSMEIFDTKEEGKRVD